MSYLELRIFWIYSIRMAKLTITILMLICGTVHASIGIIDGTQEYFHDMVEVVRGRAEVYGVLVKTSMDVELAIGMFITRLRYGLFPAAYTFSDQTERLRGLLPSRQ